MYSEDNGGKALWFVAGAAIGATIALLFAPSSGRVTRRRIARVTTRGRDAVTDQGREFMDKGRELFERGRQMADEAAEMLDRGRKIVEG
jgi:gas vesicle protein